MNKVYACSDLHGMLDLWHQIQDYMDDSDKLYFLGDAADRGPDGIQIMKELLTDTRVIYLMGNHEDLMVHEVSEILKGHSFFSTFSLWVYNGGGSTLEAFQNESLDTQKWIYDKISHLPREATYVNTKGQTIHMTHAGNTPSWTEKDWRSVGVKDAFIWNRDHFHSAWPEGFENWYEIHGHTPVQYLISELNGTAFNEDIVPNIVRYTNSHKIDLDLGCFYSNRIALLDLDSLEPIYFVTRKENS